MSINEDIQKTIDLLKTSDINGCITGSSMIGADYDTWERIPDVDLFVYNEKQLLHAVDKLMMVYDYNPATKGEAWKIERIGNRNTQKHMALQTVKLKRNDSDVIINVSWKDKRDNLFAVLSSFDMSIIMIGYDIPNKVHLDLRVGWPGMVVEDVYGKWSKSVNVAVPNPLRKQDTDMYGTKMWVRQFDRCIKYWDRGFDTRPMAEFYIGLINKVIEDGQLFESEASEEAYQAFCDEFVPVRENMKQWLEGKEDL